MAQRLRSRGLTWLLNAQDTAGGWGGGVGYPSSIEETAIAVRALAVIPQPLGKLRVNVSGVEHRPVHDVQSDLKHAMTSGVRWLVAATDEGQCTPVSPIGLYFARLWYYEELYPVVFSLSGLSHARRALRSTHLAATSSPQS
jgi:squalene-hopene/tetraprenyl-beta-curcumene cyclase